MSLMNKDEHDPLDLTYMGDVDAALHRRGHPWAFTLSCCVLLFFVIVFIWADFAMIDDVVRGMGKVIPADGVRDIQSDKGGSILTIRVNEGDAVEANEVVTVLSNVQDVSALQDLKNRSKELELSLIRLQAEAENKPLVFPKDEERAHPGIVQNQVALYEANKQRFEGEDRQLLSQIEQKRQEIQIALETREKHQKTLALLREEEAKVRGLVGRSYSQIQYLELQERVVSLDGELASVEQSIASARSAAIAAEERMKTRVAERAVAIAEERNKNRIEMEEISQRINTWTDQVGRAELRSPVKGTVKSILLKPGSVAKPADVIMQIVPSNDVLEIEAKFRPSDRGSLYVSQTGMVKFTSYDFSIYGGLKATVVRISDDTIADKRGDPWYEVRMVTERKNILYNGKELLILPGMTVSVDLLTDKRSVLDTVLRPIMEAQEDALTEH